jgi:hypothetical protein
MRLPHPLPIRPPIRQKQKQKQIGPNPGLDSAPSSWDYPRSTPVPALPARFPTSTSGMGGMLGGLQEVQAGEGGGTGVGAHAAGVQAEGRQPARRTHLDYQQKLDLINLCLEHKDRFTAGHFTDFYTFISQAYEFHIIYGVMWHTI